ncbi:MAG: LCP family protein [Lachnospiraceae bacterium]|nr:LCP family protein [Lachnospiraceae bacterium]
MKKFLTFLVVLLFVAAIGFGVYKGVAHNRAVKEANARMGVSFEDMNEKIASEYGLKSDEKIKNVLLVGTDKRGAESGYGRADAIIIATIDQKNAQLKLTNLIEDCYLEIPGYGENKLSMAYSIGGISLLYETIAMNFGVQLDNYAVLQFNSLVSIIDEIGGVVVELSDFEAAYMQQNYSNSANEVQSGKFIMNGTQALAYVRIKQDAAGEFGRAVRLRKVIKSLYSDLTLKEVNSLKELISNILKDTVTDIDSDDMRTMLASVVALSTEPLKEKTIPEEGMYQSTVMEGQTVYVTDSDKLKEGVTDYIYNPVESSAIADTEAEAE